MLRLVDVSKSYGKERVLKKLNLQVNPGEIVHIAGENGSGKTTLLSCVAGLLSVDSGEIKREYQRQAYVATSSMLYGQLTVLENLKLYGSIHQSTLDRAAQAPPLQKGTSPSNDEKTDDAPVGAALEPPGSEMDLDILIDILKLNTFLSKRISECSLGMVKRASLARALLSSPDFLILDEPFSGLDAKSLDAVIELISSLKISILFTSHNSDLLMASRSLTLINQQLLENVS